jgi:hypothetical protein
VVFFGRWNLFFAGTPGYSSDLDGHFEKISQQLKYNPENPIDRPQPMPCKGFGDGVFPKKTPSKPRKPLFLGLWPNTYFSTSPWSSSNIWRGDAGDPGQAYKKPSKISRADKLRNWV